MRTYQDLGQSSRKVVPTKFVAPIVILLSVNERNAICRQRQEINRPSPGHTRRWDARQLHPVLPFMTPMHKDVEPPKWISRDKPTELRQQVGAEGGRESELGRRFK